MPFDLTHGGDGGGGDGRKRRQHRHVTDVTIRHYTALIKEAADLDQCLDCVMIEVAAGAIAHLVENHKEQTDIKDIYKVIRHRQKEITDA